MIRDDLRNEMEERGLETAASNDSVVGASNIMQVLELCSMSEFVYETEQAALISEPISVSISQDYVQCEEGDDCGEYVDEMWPETMDLGIKKGRKALRMITNMLKVDTQGEVLASKNGHNNRI